MKALVTGGGGFLGEALTRALLAQGHQVLVLARGDYPALVKAGAQLLRGDLRDARVAGTSCEGQDVIFHVAAKAGAVGDAEEYEGINVTGTENLLAGARAAKVPHFIYTSTPSVVHRAEDIEGETEALPYATHFTAHYPRTKARAEQLVRAANTDTLKTIALRPHFIWGPGDRHLLPRLLTRAQAGRLRQVGHRDVKHDTTYIDNCVDAHLLAWAALRAGKPLGGRVYFISDDAPIGVWTMANRMLEKAKAPKVGPPVPAWLAYAAGAVLEGAHALLGLDSEPAMTRYGATELSHAQWFDISAAKQDLGYTPQVSIEQGLERMGAWLAQDARRI